MPSAASATRPGCARPTPRTYWRPSTAARFGNAVEQTLLLLVRLLGSNGRRGKLAFPVTVTSEVDRMAKGTGLEVVRTPASLAELTQYAAQDGVVFAGALGGGYVFPEFLPAYD